MRKSTYPHELIGEKIVVVDTTNSSLLGLSGKIVDETRNTLVVEYQGKFKTLLKNTITFKIKDKNIVIKGKEIIKRPEERVKG